MFLKNIIPKRPLIQAFWAIVINSDFTVLFTIIQKKQAYISQSPVKHICAPGLNCYSCPTSQFACPIGSLQVWLNEVRLNAFLGESIHLAGLYILGSIFLIGSLFGRLACGWVCPFGFIQDGINKITNINLKIPALLTKLRYVILIVFVIGMPLLLFNSATLAASPWFCKLVCPAGTLEAGAPLLLIDGGLRKAASFITLVKFVFLFLLLISFFLSHRFFCKTICPLGTMWGICNPVSLFKISLDKSTCIHCKKCENVCPMHIKLLTHPNSTKCIRCLKCINSCPQNALHFSIKNHSRIQKSGKSLSSCEK